jgi:hypothetical protein
MADWIRSLKKMLEGNAYRPGTFIVEARATRALLKFCVDHDIDTKYVLNELGAILAALEAGEKMNAVEAFKRIPVGRFAFGDWFPPAVGPLEDKDYALGVFEALMKRWHRLMTHLSGCR